MRRQDAINILLSLSLPLESDIALPRPTQIHLSLPLAWVATGEAKGSYGRNRFRPRDQTLCHQEAASYDLWSSHRFTVTWKLKWEKCGAFRLDLAILVIGLVNFVFVVFIHTNNHQACPCHQSPKLISDRPCSTSKYLFRHEIKVLKSPHWNGPLMFFFALPNGLFKAAM